MSATYPTTYSAARQRLVPRFVQRVGVVVIALAAGSALAQPAPAAPAGDGDLGFRRDIKLTPREQLAQADKWLSQMNDSAGGVRRQLERAREGRDVVKSLCLNDKLSQVDVAVRSSKERRSNLESAANRGDEELARHEFSVLGVLKQRIEQLSAQSNQCVGNEVIVSQQTKVGVSVDPTLPDDSQVSSYLPETNNSLPSDPPQYSSSNF